MGCNCGKRTASAQRAVTRAQRSVPYTLAGLSQDDPALLGSSTDANPIRVRAARPVGPLRAGQAAWVAGSQVDELLEAGDLIDISKTTQRRRLWRVGSYTYADKTKAQRVARAMGQEAVEIA